MRIRYERVQSKLAGKVLPNVGLILIQIWSSSLSKILSLVMPGRLQNKVNPIDALVRNPA